MESAQHEQVLVQVLPRAEAGREIGFGSTFAEQLDRRLDDIRAAIAAGARTIAGSLDGLPRAQDWRLSEVSASFGITLTAEAGVLVTKTSAGATFEVSVTYSRSEP